MSRKHKKTLKAIFTVPPLSNVKWKDIETLFVYLGTKLEEGRGSRLRVILNTKLEEGRGSRLRVILNREEAVFHRPHPRKETDKGALVSVRRFLENVGVKP